MSSLQNKMNNYEVVPPANVWDKISTALDESNLQNEFPSKLYNAEVTPPAIAWENIQSTLSPEETKVVTMRRKAPAFIRYAVAAMLIGLATFGVIRLTTTTSSEGTVAASGTDTAGNRNTATGSAPSETQTPIATPDNRDLLVAEAQPAKVDARKAAPKVSSALYTYGHDNYVDPNYDYAETTPNMVDKYIMMMTPEGNIIRMSKKLSDMVCCVSGEEQDDDCKSQIKKWQEKIATSLPDASSGNFLDILTLVNSLEQGNEL